ncbi:cholesterol side-chain cleavage enzyme, mitochondrial-like [Pristis pectinata]|uniref:cholesterol side-chain cleavage enzyme, mitochondrial-like n=1 Tax=Pristis pectinata TaxID=685728 RepID=UPI00223CF79A|nr:cholesterol side-chain cleavage enzyme, mitochondrial-like [Pristis pectinata]
MKIKSWVAHRDLRKLSYGILLKSGEDWKRNRLILNKELLAPEVVQKFVPHLNEVALDFVSMVNRNIEKSRRGHWAADISNDLFKFALESVHYILHGERLDLLQGYCNPASQMFIDSVLKMFKSTVPILNIPVGLLKSINAKVWQEHIDSWDIIYKHANDSIQRAYRYMHQRVKNDKAYLGILAELLMQDISLEDITVNIMELNAGGIDTTSITLLWTMYSLAKYPNIQKNLRSEIMEANQKTGGDPVQMLQSVPLLKGALKETLRLYPVAITLQRYIVEDIALQDYHIPAGTLVQTGLFAMGRSPEIFSNPEQYNPERWLKHGETSFRHLGFGFGPRQCIGRRLAETEILLLLIQMLQNFNIETTNIAEVKPNFDLILLPEKPINLVFKAIN